MLDKRITILVSPELYEELRAISYYKNTPISEIVREAIEKHLPKKEKA